MITHKKEHSVSSVADSWFGRAIPAFFSAKRLGRAEAVKDKDPYCIDNEDIVLGYESGWPSSFKKPN